MNFKVNRDWVKRNLENAQSLDPEKKITLTAGTLANILSDLSGLRSFYELTAIVKDIESLAAKYDTKPTS